ncbi:hypothetical protein EUGRSUZ_B01030 [Eucalyptus grandis]|uniref:Uncharacterized protein n=2 Tax=Eucalyptus grandis TaxID=71139 RepID=A0ACC3LPH2_EUCGR|nr:hypothetical protein EUGRSUZ_B01030 [Eucalyptus grandis]
MATVGGGSRRLEGFRLHQSVEVGRVCSVEPSPASSFAPSQTLVSSQPWPSGRTRGFPRGRREARRRRSIRFPRRTGMISRPHPCSPSEDVQGRNVLTNFWGMDFTTDKLRSLVRKWQTLIEAHVDVKTTDNYTLRMFCIGFTKRRPNQVKRTCYAQSSQIRQIRRKMREIMVNQATTCDLKELVRKFIPEMIGKEIEKATSSIYPLQNVFIRKVHGDYSEDIGVKLDRPADEPVAEVPTEVIGA